MFTPLKALALFPSEILYRVLLTMELGLGADILLGLSEKHTNAPLDACSLPACSKNCASVWLDNSNSPTKGQTHPGRIREPLPAPCSFLHSIDNIYNCIFGSLSNAIFLTILNPCELSGTSILVTIMSRR